MYSVSLLWQEFDSSWISREIYLHQGFRLQKSAFAYGISIGIRNSIESNLMVDLFGSLCGQLVGKGTIHEDLFWDFPAMLVCRYKVDHQPLDSKARCWDLIFPYFLPPIFRCIWLCTHYIWTLGFLLSWFFTWWSHVIPLFTVILGRGTSHIVYCIVPIGGPNPEGMVSMPLTDAK